MILMQAKQRKNEQKQPQNELLQLQNDSHLSDQRDERWNLALSDLSPQLVED